MVIAVCLLAAGQLKAEYYNYSNFTIIGPLAGTVDGAFPWSAGDNAWEQGLGYAWTFEAGANSSRAIMKYGNETAAPLTFQRSIPNGTYEISVVDVFTGNSTSNPTFPFTVNGQAASLVANDSTAWIKTYSLGTFTVTNGTITIVAGNPFGDSSHWLGFSGFYITKVRASDFGKQWIRNHDFTIMGLTANTQAYNPLQYRDANMSYFLEWQPNNENQLVQNATVGLPWFILAQPVPGVTEPELHYLAYRFMSLYPGNCGWLVYDEPNISDFPSVAVRANWYRQNFPDSLVYVTMGGHEFQNNPAQYATDFINTIKPDIITYDSYQCLDNGTTTNNYPLMNVMRDKGLSLDRPYWAWIQSYGNTDGLRMPSESDLRVQIFSHLTYGFTGIAYFTYTPERGPGTSMANSNLSLNPLYYYAQTVNPEIAKLGRTLKYLRSLEVCYVRGKLNSTTYNPVPTGAHSWVWNSGADTAITNIEVSGTGSSHNGLIGFFTDDAGQLYFMLTNLKNGPNLTAAQAALSFTITFNTSIGNSIYRLNRTTGLVDTVPLDAQRKVVITLPGGTGDLFKYYWGNFVSP